MAAARGNRLILAGIVGILIAWLGLPSPASANRATTPAAAAPAPAQPNIVLPNQQAISQLANVSVQPQPARFDQSADVILTVHYLRKGFSSEQALFDYMRENLVIMVGTAPASIEGEIQANGAGAPDATVRSIILSIPVRMPPNPDLTETQAQSQRLAVTVRGSSLKPVGTTITVAPGGAGPILYLIGLLIVAILIAAATALYFWTKDRATRRTMSNLTEQFGRQAVEASEIAISTMLEEASPATGPRIAEGRRGQDAPILPDPRGDGLPDPPDELVQAIAGQQAVLVLGHGLSVEAGVPGGAALLLRLIQGLGEAAPRALAKVTESDEPEAALAALVDRLGGFSKVMDALTSSAPRPILASLIADACRAAGTAPSAMPVLAQLPWRAAVTLAWDDLAADAFIAKAPRDPGPMRGVTLSDALDLAASSRAGERLLFKPLGDLVHSPQTAAFTMDEMRRLMQRYPEFQRALAGLIHSNSFLFLGVDIDTLEQFFHAISPELESPSLRHFVLVPSDPANEVRQASLSRYGIQLISHEPAPGRPILLEFARDLRGAVRRALAAQSTNDGVSRFYLSPARISRVRLESIGPFERLELVLESAGDPSSAPWTVIFGGNGVGKSSILRAIALVLAGDHPAALAAGRRLLRTGASEGLIEVQLGDQILKTRLTRDRSSVIVTSLQQTPVGSGNALALGFPALRGARSAEPSGPTANADLRDPDPGDLIALIGGEVDDRLADFKQWLVNTLTKAKDGNARAILMRDLIDSNIRDLVPGQIDALAPLSDDFIIRVKTPEGEVPFDDLSQGMASIFNWVGLLVQRLFTICEMSDKANEEPAIVIIDEVDAHLHPDWQRRLVKLTRSYFPNTQVIATSHSPLLAGALRGSELIVLERDPVNRQVTQLAGIGDPFGLPSQDILTGFVFGMTTDRNPEVEDLIAEYFSIFQKPQRSPDDERRLAELGHALRQFRYGGAPVDLPELPELSAAEVERINSRLAPGGTEMAS